MIEEVRNLDNVLPQMEDTPWGRHPTVWGSRIEINSFVLRNMDELIKTRAEFRPPHLGPSPYFGGCNITSSTTSLDFFYNGVVYRMIKPRDFKVKPYMALDTLRMWLKLLL